MPVRIDDAARQPPQRTPAEIHTATAVMQGIPGDGCEVWAQHTAPTTLLQVNGVAWGSAGGACSGCAPREVKHQTQEHRYMRRLLGSLLLALALLMAGVAVSPVSFVGVATADGGSD